MEKAKGFTLIELLIVIAIVGIISAIAYPSFRAYMIKAHRADAQTELIKAQLAQTSHHILNPTFTSSVTDIGLPISHDYYDFSVVSSGKTTYLMKAVAKVGTIQVEDDEQCRVLFINQNSFHSKDGTIGNEECW
ncbi:MAG: type IV pilin protein [Psychromonas sp.]